MKLLGRAEVPLTDETGDVPGGLESIGDSGLAERQAAVPPRSGVELVAEPLLVAAGHQPGARRRAIRPGDVAAGEPDAGFRQRVEIRSGNVLAALNTGIGETHVVADDEDDVGRRIRGLNRW